jgi:hypothetical protein
LEFGLHDKWVSRLLRFRLKEPLKGYVRTTVEQLEAADRELFNVMAAECRDGVIPDLNGARPLDAAILEAMADVEVNQHLAPLPHGRRGHDEHASGASKAKRPSAEAPDANNDNRQTRKKPNHSKEGGGKSRGRGKGRGKGPSLPAGLSGSTRSPDGSAICFGYNLGTCDDPSCSRGRHICCKCFGGHSFVSTHSAS